MYLVRLAALILAGMLVSACAATTFESLHYGEGGRPENSGGLTQSYYVPKTLLSVEIKRAGGERIIQLAKESVRLISKCTTTTVRCTTMIWSSRPRRRVT